MALQDAARDIANAHFCVPPHFKPPKRVPATFRAPSVSVLLRTPDCVLVNPEDVAVGGASPRLRCEGGAAIGVGSGDVKPFERGTAVDDLFGGEGASSGGGDRSEGFLRMQIRRHPPSYVGKHVTRPEYVGPTCKLSACFAVGLFPGARPESEREDGYRGDDFLAVLSSRCGNPIERVLARKRWVIPLIG